MTLELILTEEQVVSRFGQEPIDRLKAYVGGGTVERLSSPPGDPQVLWARVKDAAGNTLELEWDEDNALWWF